MLTVMRNSLRRVSKKELRRSLRGCRMPDRPPLRSATSMRLQDISQDRDDRLCEPSQHSLYHPPRSLLSRREGSFRANTYGESDPEPEARLREREGHAGPVREEPPPA